MDRKTWIALIVVLLPVLLGMLVSFLAQRLWDPVRLLDHEMKNPLTGLRSALVNLQETGTPGERRQAAENAHRAVDRLTRLLNDLRKLSDLEERSIEHMPVDVPGLLDEVVETARSIPAYRGRSVNLLITKVPSPLP